MGEINIGKIIASCRRSEGITQEELAEYLGVTKAAVSKWELGINLPDITLIPKVAAFFRISIDELFDWHPQLSSQQIKEISADMISKLSEDPAGVFAKLEKLNVEYASCWEWLISSVQVSLMSTSLASEWSDKYIECAFKALDRIEQYCTDMVLVFTAQLQRAALLQLNENTLEEAAVILEGLRRYPDNVVDVPLASIYERQGRKDEALQLKQSSLYFNVSQLITLISSSLKCSDNFDFLTSWVNAGQSLIDGFGIDECVPSFSISFYLESAKAYLRFSEAERAYEQLYALKGVIENNLNKSISKCFSDSFLFSDICSTDDNLEFLISQTKRAVLMEIESNDLLISAFEFSENIAALLRDIRLLVETY